MSWCSSTRRRRSSCARSRCPAAGSTRSRGGRRAAHRARGRRVHLLREHPARLPVGRLRHLTRSCSHTRSARPSGPTRACTLGAQDGPQDAKYVRTCATSRPRARAARALGAAHRARRRVPGASAQRDRRPVDSVISSAASGTESVTCHHRDRRAFAADATRRRLRRGRYRVGAVSPRPRPPRAPRSAQPVRGERFGVAEAAGAVSTRRACCGARPGASTCSTSTRSSTQSAQMIDEPCKAGRDEGRAVRDAARARRPDLRAGRRARSGRHCAAGCSSSRARAACCSATRRRT